jgi:hypothetical protein
VADRPGKLLIRRAEPLNLAQPCLVSDPGSSGIPVMSPRHGRHAKITSRHGGRPAGTSRQAQPLSLVLRQGRPGFVSGWRRVCAAGHSLRRHPPGEPGHRRRGGSRCRDDRRPRALITRTHHAATRPACTVICGVTLPGISARLCGPPAGCQALASPDLIYSGQAITRAYDATVAACAFPSPPGPSASSQALAQQPETPAAGIGRLHRKDRTGYAS